VSNVVDGPPDPKRAADDAKDSELAHRSAQALDGLEEAQRAGDRTEVALDEIARARRGS